jgi:hypothetical protein
MQHEEIAAALQEITTLTEEQAGVVERIRALQAEEDPAGGIFRSGEIHAAKQEKLRLDFEIQLRTNRINRLRFGAQP